MAAERPWLAHYPAGVPAEIDPDEYPSVSAVFERSVEKFRDRPAFTNFGKVLTYGEVAARVGADASARAVGQSLGRNAMPIVVPCHRVVATGGGLGGFSAPGGTRTKRRMLAIEDAHPSGPPGLFDATARETEGGGAAASGQAARTG